MTERIALVVKAGLPVKARLPWRALVLAALLSTVAVVALSRGLPAIVGTSSSPPAAVVHRAYASELRSLSPSARASISAALGAESPSYRFSASSVGLATSNAAQRLGIVANGSGLAVRSRGLELRLSLGALGYGGRLRAVAPARPEADANRVTYAHAGIEESYVNGPLGLEQSFTVAHAPAGEGAGTGTQPLTLAVAASGDALASLAADAQSVTFRGAHGGSLRYGRVGVSDASGRALHGWLALDGGRLLLRVDTRDARFPLRIDPAVEQGPQNELRLPEEESKEERQHAGVSVALSGNDDVALVGAPDGLHSSGAVYVFERSSGENWAQTAKLEMPQPETEPTSCPEEGGDGEEAEECRFGWTVALSSDGETALIGAPQVGFEKGEGEPAAQAGAAWVFAHTVSGWQPTKLSSPEPELDGHFGRSVALSSDGEVALVGAPGEASAHGRAWVFKDSGASWSALDTALEGAGESGPAHLGRSVALSGSGETALVGAPGDDDFTGAAWLFVSSGPGWSELGPKLTGTGVTAGAHFGNSVALSQDGATALVGAPDNAGGAGAAWAFAQAGSTWSEQGAALVGEGESEEHFATSVALSADGSSAVLGAPRFDSTRGAALVYERSGEAWGGAVTRLEGIGAGSAGARFGQSVAISSGGEIELVGAPLDRSRRGAAWVFGPGPGVSAVKPNHGHAAGGTEVEISGEHLTGATAVRFGESEAASFEVESPHLIKAMTPPGTGSVEVSVETAIARSVNPEAQFMYEPPGHGTGKKEGQEEATGGTGGTPSLAGETHAPTGTQGDISVLAIGPEAGGACAATLLSKRISVGPYNHALLKLVGTGAGRCAGKLRLRVKIGLGHRRFKLKTIGTAIFSIASGKRLSVSVKLNAAGRALLRAGHGRLNASLLIVRSSPAPLLARTASVRLTRRATAKPKPKALA
jgi:hypothetical protein